MIYVDRRGFRYRQLRLLKFSSFSSLIILLQFVQSVISFRSQFYFSWYFTNASSFREENNQQLLIELHYYRRIIAILVTRTITFPYAEKNLRHRVYRMI